MATKSSPMLNCEQGPGILWAKASFQSPKLFPNGTLQELTQRDSSSAGFWVTASLSGL